MAGWLTTGTGIGPYGADPSTGPSSRICSGGPCGDRPGACGSAPVPVPVPKGTSANPPVSGPCGRGSDGSVPGRSTADQAWVSLPEVGVVSWTSRSSSSRAIVRFPSAVVSEEHTSELQSLAYLV